MNRFKRYSIFPALAWLLLALLLPVSAVAVPPPLDEEALLAAETPPPIPPGFESEEEVMAAIMGGKIRVLSPLMNIAIPEGVVEIKDIEYGSVGDRQLLLDLYMPEKLDKPTPTLLFIHGGGWEQGGRSDYKYYTVRYAKRGYVVATMSYRFAKEAPFPGCVEDAKCAVRWMRANAGKYHIDPDRIAAIGGSAGGHLAMMVGYSPDVPELEGEGGHAEQSSAVQAVVNYYGPVDLTVPVQRDHPILVNFFAGQTYEEVPDQYAQASPITHLDKTDPPTLIFHGTIDNLVPIAQADMLDAKLTELGIAHVYDRIEGYPHSLDLAEAVNIHCQWHIDHFLAEHLAEKE